MLFLLTIVWPTVALLARCALDAQPPRGGCVISARQWALLGKSVAVAAGGIGVALIVSLPGVYVVGRLGRLSHRPAVGALLVGSLLFSPMVYVFGWQKLLPADFPGQIQCVGVWALWSYPIAALLIGTGWSRVGRGAYEAALLDMSPATAFVRVVLPMLRLHVVTACMILFVIFLGEYSVPHACGMLVYSTELLGWSEESPYAIDTLWRSLPLIGLILVALLAARGAWKRGVADEQPVEGTGVKSTSPILLLLAAGCFVVSVLLPLTALAVNLKSPAVMGEALRTYGGELAQSLAVAGLSGLLVTGMGVCVIAYRPLRRVALVWALGFGVLPGAVVGEAVLAAYRNVPVIYDHWCVVVVAFVARFGWIGVLAMIAAVRATPPELFRQARSDGASETSIALRICAALSWPTLLFGACLAAAMSLCELPTSALVRVPALGLIAHILTEKFHRFEDGMLISLSLWLVMSALPAAILLAMLLQRQEARGKRQ